MVEFLFRPQPFQNGKAVASRHQRVDDQKGQLWAGTIFQILYDFIPRPSELQANLRTNFFEPPLQEESIIDVIVTDQHVDIRCHAYHFECSASRQQRKALRHPFLSIIAEAKESHLT